MTPQTTADDRVGGAGEQPTRSLQDTTMLLGETVPTKDSATPTAGKPRRAPRGIPFTARNAVEYNGILRALHERSGLTKKAAAEQAEVPARAVTRMLSDSQASLPERIDYVLALGVAWNLDVELLDRLEAIWDDLSAGFSGDRKARWARTTYAERDAAREKVDGVWVSTLLGTEDHPEHGESEFCYTFYRCHCPLCTASKTKAWVKWDTEQRTERRTGIVREVLLDSWPGEAPSEQNLSEAIEAVIDRWASARRYRLTSVTKTLGELWPNIEQAKLELVSAKIVDRLATTSRRGARDSHGFAAGE